MKNILMNAEMTKATLNGRKTQTRRAITKFYDLSLEHPKRYPISFKDVPKDLKFEALQGFGNPCPLFYSKSKDKFYCGKEIKYKTGDIIWVREPAEVIAYDNKTKELIYRYKADDNINAKSILMPDRFLVPNTPKWAYNCQGIPNGCIKEMARTFVVNIGTRVEKLQDISVSDIEKEGIAFDTGRLEKYCNTDDEFNDKVCEEFFERWIEYWNKTAQKGYKWKDNPYVFVYEFKKINNIKKVGDK